MRGSNKTYLKVISNLLTALVILALCVFILPKIIIFFMPFLIEYSTHLLYNFGKII